MREANIHGYCDVPSVAPGERIRFYVSCEEEGSYRADVVRLVYGDTNPAGPGFKEEVVETDANAEYPARFQPTHAGSHVLVEDGGRLHATQGLTLHAFVQPTTPGKGPQGILARWAAGTGAGYALMIDDSGRLSFVVGDGVGGRATVTADEPLLGSVWYSVAATWNPEGSRLSLTQRPVVNSVNSLIGPVVPVDGAGSFAAGAEVSPADAGVPFVVAGWIEEAGRTVVGGHYSGKIDGPRVYGRSLAEDELATLSRGEEPDAAGLLARWDFAEGIGRNGIPTDRVGDVSGSGLHGACVNQPARAMTGWNWQGLEENFVHAPEQYGAIHFHDDDLDDCRWEADFELTVPEEMRCGVYAARLRIGESEDHVPFFVRPPRGRATAPILLLIPTASYLAYANDHIVMDVPVGQAIIGHTSVISEQDLYLYTHPEYGLSTYDAHTDFSGVAYTSWRRPIINMRPKFRHATGSVWQFPADLHLVDWLEQSEFEYDVATDHDLHEEGVDLLQRYKAVVTGTHPEYYSTPMLDAFEAYLADGGRAMYLGSNGFYWIVSFHPEKPYVMEVRRGESGSRAWQAKPGEYYHSTTGERGGLWRNRGRPPQKIFGVGFTSEGFDRSHPYFRMPDSFDERARFIFEGVKEDELIGDFGLAGGGAAGYEIDRYELALGTPPHALLLASSEGFGVNYPHVVEEVMFAFPGMDGTQDPQVRADIVYFSTPNDGAVFSTSSISWCGSLSHDGYDNNVSRITANVLRAFANEERLP